jgi:hypothetical protein
VTADFVSESFGVIVRGVLITVLSQGGTNFIALLGTSWLDTMSAYGTKQTSILTLNMSAFGGKADIADPLANVR